MSENFDEKIYEMIIHSLNEFRDSMKDFKIEIKKDIDRLYDIHSKINEKVIKLEGEVKGIVNDKIKNANDKIKMLFGLFTGIGLLLGGILSKIIYDWITK